MTTYALAGSLAEAVLVAQRLVREAGTAEGLREAAGSITTTARSVGCSTLMPVSAASRGVVSAAVLLSDGYLREASDSDVLLGHADKVLLVEVAAISGTTARARAEQVRAEGATWVGLLVLHNVASDPAAGPDRYGDLDELVLSA